MRPTEPVKPAGVLPLEINGNNPVTSERPMRPEGRPMRDVSKSNGAGEKPSKLEANVRVGGEAEAEGHSAK